MGATAAAQRARRRGRGPLRRAQHEFTFRFRLLWEMKACVRHEKGADGTGRESACEEYIDI